MVSGGKIVIFDKSYRYTDTLGCRGFVKAIVELLAKLTRKSQVSLCTFSMTLCKSLWPKPVILSLRNMPSRLKLQLFLDLTIVSRLA